MPTMTKAKKAADCFPVIWLHPRLVLVQDTAGKRVVKSGACYSRIRCFGNFTLPSEVLQFLSCSLGTVWRKKTDLRGPGGFAQNVRLY